MNVQIVVNLEENIFKSFSIWVYIIHNIFLKVLFPLKFVFCDKLRYSRICRHSLKKERSTNSMEICETDLSEIKPTLLDPNHTFV